MPTIGYFEPLKVLVAVRGHPFDRTAFDRLFEGMEGIDAVMVDHPAAAQLINPQAMAEYAALILYDMPGLDFSGTHGMPAMIDPPEAFKQGLEALLEQGKGIVALHHALAGWPNWPRYGEILGGRFLYRPAQVRGDLRLDSGYAHDVEYQAECLAPEHPVLADVPVCFPMKDELYLAEVFDDSVQPLLRARHDFTAANFYSASAALEGRMNDNDGWEHPQGSDLIGWTREEKASRVVYLQPGDGADAYGNVHYRHIVENAIRWASAT